MQKSHFDNQIVMSSAASWLLFLATACIMFVTSFSTMATMGALAEMRHSLQLSLSSQAWVMVGFSITVMACVMSVGQLCKRYGYLPLFVCGLIVFFASGVINALTESAWLLIVGRVIQGLSYAFLFPTTLGLLKYGPKKSLRELFLVLWIACQLIGYFVGPLSGGVLAEHASWRIIYWINCVFSVLALGLTACFFRQCKIATQKVSFDFLGFILLLALSVIIVLTVSEGSYWGWVSPALISFYALMPTLLVLLLLSQKYSKSPMLDLSIFKNLAFVIGSLQYFVLGAIIYGMYYFINLFLQDNSSINYGSTAIGILFLVLGAPIVFFSLTANYLQNKFGFFANFLVGTIVVAAALFFFWLLSNATVTMFWWKMLVLGVGLGMSYSLCSGLAISNISDAKGGEAAALINLGNYLGCTLGISLVQLIYLHVVKSKIILLQSKFAVLKSISLAKLLALPHERLSEFNHFIANLPVAAMRARVAVGLKHAVDCAFSAGSLYFLIWALVAVAISFMILLCANR